MDVQVCCQIVFVVMQVLGFFQMVYFDFNGREAKRPSGFPGFIASCIVIVIGVAMAYGAGMYSTLIRE